MEAGLQVELNRSTVSPAAGWFGPGPGADRRAAAVPADLPGGIGVPDRGLAGAEHTADPGTGLDPGRTQAHPSGRSTPTAGPKAVEGPSRALQNPSAAASQQHAPL